MKGGTSIFYCKYKGVGGGGGLAKTVTETETLAMAKACLSSPDDDDDEDTKRKCGNERVKYSKDVITALSPDRRRASESSRVSDSKPWGEVGALSPALSPSAAALSLSSLI